MPEQKNKENISKKKVEQAQPAQEENKAFIGEDLGRAKKENFFLVCLAIFVFVLLICGGFLLQKILTFKSSGPQISLSQCMSGHLIPDDEQRQIIAPKLEENNISAEKAEDAPLIPLKQNINKTEEKPVPEVSEEVIGLMNNIRKRSEIFFPEIRYLDLEWKTNEGEQESLLTIKSMRYSIKRTQLKEDKPSIEELFVKDNFQINKLNSVSMNKTKVGAYEKNNMACVYSVSPSIDIVTQQEVPNRFDISLSCGLLPKK